MRRSWPTGGCWVKNKQTNQLNFVRTFPFRSKRDKTNHTQFYKHIARNSSVTRSIFTKVKHADKFLARPGRKQARKHVSDAGDFNNIETRAVFQFLFLQGKAPKEIHAILTKTLPCFLPGRVKDLLTPLYFGNKLSNTLYKYRGH